MVGGESIRAPAVYTHRTAPLPESSAYNVCWSAEATKTRPSATTGAVNRPPIRVAHFSAWGISRPA